MSEPLTSDPKIFSSHQSTMLTWKTPEELALSNSVILEEIYNKIRNPWDREYFRLISRSCYKETLPILRRSVTLKLDTEDNNFEKFYNHYISWPEGLESLSKYPYRNVRLWSDLPPITRLKTNWDKFFWRVCGPHITTLELDHCNFSFHDGALGFIKQVFNLCPLLEEIKILRCSEEVEPIEYDSTDENEDEEGNKVEYKKVAENLKTIWFITDIGSKFYSAAFFRRVLRLTPNLKNLTLGGFLDPIENYISFHLMKQKLKLQKLAIVDNCNCLYYVGRLFLGYITEHPQTIRELDFCLQFGVIDNIADNFWLFKCIGECECLEKLILRCVLNEKADVFWYRDLDIREVKLQTLKELRVKIELDHNTQLLERVRFDFGMLKRTPKLKTLSIKYNLVAGTPLERKPGLEDWVFRESEEQNLEILWEPSAVLQKLEFAGWGLNQSDVEILHEKFPKLSFLGALFENGTLLGLAAKLWKENLKIFEIYTTKEQYESETFWKEFNDIKREYPRVTFGIKSAYLYGTRFLQY